jgi:putative endonuclease
MYYTYILYSAKFDRIYIGQTENLASRLERHNQGKVRSTKAYIPWKMINYEQFKSRSEAMKREKELKSHNGRDWIREEFFKKTKLVNNH